MDETPATARTARGHGRPEESTMADSNERDTFTIRDLKIQARAEVVMGDGAVAVVTLAPTALLGNWSATEIRMLDGTPVAPGLISALRRIEEAAGLSLWADGVRVDRPIEVT